MPAAEGIKLDGVVIPSMPNIHSHAFQRAMAGLSEYKTAKNDSFWTWRQLMYQFLETLGPDEIEEISILNGPNAAALYGVRGANGAILIQTKSE